MLCGFLSRSTGLSCVSLSNPLQSKFPFRIEVNRGCGYSHDFDTISKCRMPSPGRLRMAFLLVSPSPKQSALVGFSLSLRIDLKRTLSALSEIPDSILKAELLRRDGASDDTPACGSKERGAYNTPLHVMALFLIFILSTFGMGHHISLHKVGHC